MRSRKKCPYCRSFIEDDGIVHKCSEKKLKALERNAIRRAEQKHQNLINPERTYDDRLQEAEIMMNLDYVNNRNVVSDLGLYAALVHTWR